MDFKKTVFITKYALTAGIYECKIDHMFDDDTVCVDGLYSRSLFHGEGREWHMTLEGANERVRAMSIKKLKELEARILKVQRALTNDVRVLRQVRGTWR